MSPHTSGSTPESERCGPRDNPTVNRSSLDNETDTEGRENGVDFSPETERFFETSLDLLAISTTDGHFIDVNPRFEEVLGWSRKELTSRPFLEFVHPEDRDATRACLENNQTGDRTIRGFVNRYQCADGSYVWLKWQSRMFEDDDYIYASARDVTDLRRARIEKQRLQEQTLRAHQLESVSELAGGIAHEFNNRLTTIIGHAGLLADEVDAPDLEQRISAIEHAAGEAEELCRQLLTYAGEDELERQPENLSAIVRSSNRLLESIASDDTSIRYDLDESLTPASVDPAQMRRVAMNLVANADDAIIGSGGITISTYEKTFDRNSLDDNVYGSELEAGQYTVLEVSDTGSGMETEVQERMFEPFFTTKFLGRGVGLAATLGIVRAHNGTIVVDSEPGDGSRMSVLLPIHTGKTPDTEHHRTDQLPTGSILVADDFSAVSLVRRALSDTEIDVKTASTDTGLFNFIDKHDDWLAVLIDPLHPQFREIRVVKRLIERLRHQTPVIASTIRPSSTGPTRGDVELADHVLEKPYTVGQLTEALTSTITSTTE